MGEGCHSPTRSSPLSERLQRLFEGEKMMRLRPQRLTSTKSEIAERFARQCLNGPQNASLPADVKACGQFLDEEQSRQRGTHGTAAAIRGLAADGGDDGRGVLP